MSHITCTAAPNPTQRLLWQRGVLNLLDVWREWRQARSHRQQVRALQGLSCATLRDIGLNDQLPPCHPTLSALDYQRGLW